MIEIGKTPVMALAKQFEGHWQVSQVQINQSAIDFLATLTPYSKSKLKDAMNKGAVWLTRQGKEKRLRRARFELRPGDRLDFYYDEAMLALRLEPPPQLIEDLGQYSLWFKPAGWLTQGTRYGDHCALIRHIEAYWQQQRLVYLVHRLDREAQGLILLAHDKNQARYFSQLFVNRSMVKIYYVEVRGWMPGDLYQWQQIDFPLEGEAALTRYQILARSEADNGNSMLKVQIFTGRKHQIRRHLDMLGFPVLGDPRYGKANKNTEGLRLMAVELRFICPLSRREKIVNLPRELAEFMAGSQEKVDFFSSMDSIKLCQISSGSQIK